MLINIIIGLVLSIFLATNILAFEASGSNYTIDQTLGGDTGGEITSVFYNATFSSLSSQNLYKLDDENYKGILGILKDDTINPTKVEIDIYSVCNNTVCFTLTIENEGVTGGEYPYYYWSSDGENDYYTQGFVQFQGSKYLDPGEEYILDRCVSVNISNNYIRAKTVYDIYESYSIGSIAGEECIVAGGVTTRSSDVEEIGVSHTILQQITYNITPGIIIAILFLYLIISKYKKNSYMHLVWRK